MKKLSFEEFDQKAREVMRSRKIFIKSCVTNNLTVAYELYKKVLRDEESCHEYFARFVPVCPKCGSKRLKRFGDCGYFEKHEFCEACDYERILDKR